MSTITAKNFGRHADRVEDFGGEYTLPVGDGLEIHPGANGDWSVVAISTGEVLCRFADIDDAVSYAESR